MSELSSKALAEQDVARMRPAVQLYQRRLAEASDEFVLSQKDVPTMFVGYLACLGREVGDALFALRHVDQARDLFDEAVARRLAERSRCDGGRI